MRVDLTREGEVEMDLVCEGGDEKLKETHTDQYLNFSSNHPVEHKRGVVKTLKHRADTVVSDMEERRQELDHIRGALRVNGYPD